MSNSFKFIDHTADIAVELTGDSLEELFVAAEVAFRISVTDFECSEISDSLEIDLTAASKEELLVNFLNEINFLLITKKWLWWNVESIKIFNDENEWELSAELGGIKLNSDIELKQEIKAVTYHQLEIINDNNSYSTRIVFDI